MMTPLTFIIGASSLWVFSLLLDRRTAAMKQFEQLEQMVVGKAVVGVCQEGCRNQQRIYLKGLSDRLGRAAYFSKSERKQAVLLFMATVSFTTAIGAVVGLAEESFTMGAALSLVGLYIGCMLILYYLRWRAANLERQIMYGAPLLVESLILLVESGLGILPALHEIVSTGNRSNRDPIKRVIGEVYELSAAGMSFGNSLKSVSDCVPHRVLRHILLHLDISGNEGGELVPALRSLGDHAHNEWKTSVESRVKRLENFIVFPVFLSIMGLMCLVAAAPLAPLLEVVHSLDSNDNAFNSGVEQPNND